MEAGVGIGDRAAAQREDGKRCRVEDVDIADHGHLARDVPERSRTRARPVTGAAHWKTVAERRERPKAGVTPPAARSLPDADGVERGGAG